MGPGPCNPYPEVQEALIRPMLGHLDPEFVALLDETCERLRQVFRTSNPLTLPISGTGSVVVVVVVDVVVVVVVVVVAVAVPDPLEHAAATATAAVTATTRRNIVST